MTRHIGFIGLGMMGHGIAKNLLAEGFALSFTVHRSRDHLQDLLDAGAREVASIAALAASCDIVMICVTGSPQVEAIVHGDGGLLAAAPAGLTIVDMSTSEPASSSCMREDFAGRGVTFIDAPLARTPKEAEEGRLNIMVGAETADFERLKPVFAAFCENIIHVGGPGHGHVLKLINNMLAMTMAASIAEAMAAAAKAGLSLPKVHAVLSAGAVNSGILQMTLGRALEGDLAGLKFSIGNARKDLRYYTHLTETLPTTSHIAEAVHQSFVQAANLGFADRYIASLFEVQQQLNAAPILKP